MGSFVSYLDYVYMENPEGESLTHMTVCHSHDEPLLGPSYVTVTIEMTYFFNFFCVVLLVLFATSCTNIDPL